MSDPADTLPLPKSFRDWIPGKTLYASFSGGADSSALVLALARHGIPFTAIHFTHGIRPPEIGEAEWQFCDSFCRNLSVPVRRLHLDVPARRHPREGLEAAARRCRLDAWETILKDSPGSACVVTAHHGDDVRENLLLRLFRGGNVSSLAGLRERSTVNGITFLRPLLAYSKQELQDYLRDAGISCWAEDATNAEEDAARNFLRNRILPMIGERLAFAPGGITASAAALAEDAAFLEEAAETAAAGDLSDVRYWKSLHPAIRVRVMRIFLSRTAGRTVIPDRRLMERFEVLLSQPRTRRVRQMPVAGTDLCLTRSGDRIGMALIG